MVVDELVAVRCGELAEYHWMNIVEAMVDEAVAWWCTQKQPPRGQQTMDRSESLPDVENVFGGSEIADDVESYVSLKWIVEIVLDNRAGIEQIERRIGSRTEEPIECSRCTLPVTIEDVIRSFRRYTESTYNPIDERCAKRKVLWSQIQDRGVGLQ
jgi:hypothetical protein